MTLRRSAAPAPFAPPRPWRLFSRNSSSSRRVRLRSLCEARPRRARKLAAPVDHAVALAKGRQQLVAPGVVPRIHDPADDLPHHLLERQHPGRRSARDDDDVRPLLGADDAGPPLLQTVELVLEDGLQLAAVDRSDHPLAPRGLRLRIGGGQLRDWRAAAESVQNPAHETGQLLGGVPVGPEEDVLERGGLRQGEAVREVLPVNRHRFLVGDLVRALALPLHVVPGQEGAAPVQIEDRGSGLSVSRLGRHHLQKGELGENFGHSLLCIHLRAGAQVAGVEPGEVARRLGPGDEAAVPGGDGILRDPRTAPGSRRQAQDQQPKRDRALMGRLPFHLSPPPRGPSSAGRMTIPWLRTPAKREAARPRVGRAARLGPLKEGKAQSRLPLRGITGSRTS
jgi:hypothetical protein